MWTIHCCTGVTLEAQIYVESLSEMYDCVYGYGVCLWASAMKCNTLSEIHTLLIVCTALCLHCLGLSHSGSPHNVLHSNSYLHLSNTQGIYIFIHSIGNVFVYCYTCSSIRTVFVYLTLVLCPIMEDNTIMHSMVSSWPLV